MPRSSERKGPPRREGLPPRFYQQKSIAQIKIHQSSLDRILEENEQLRACHQPTATPPPTVLETNAHKNNEGNEAAQNPIVEERPWFTHIKTSDPPIWIGEMADAAFATRFRQFASSPQTPSHIPRVQYATDETLLSLSSSSLTWPSPTRARFLAEAALRSLCRCYHIVRRSEILSALETMTQDGLRPPKEPIFVSKMWALFAIGELYANRSAASSLTFPGLAYFAHASEMLRVVSERPQLDVVETMLLLSLYSLQLNRRHSACILAGSAMRVATVMGLHLTIDHAHIPDAEIREHRNRLWWTTYVFDRMWCSKVGLPVLVSDDDISVDLPSEAHGPNADDFVDHEYLKAGVKLAKIAGTITKSIYDRRNTRGPFSRRVQEVRKALRLWSEELPAHLQLNQPIKPDGKVISQQLSFNQLLILTTRPILLLVLREHLAALRGTGEESRIPESARAIADACCRAARHSCSLLEECWINGTFHVFDYFYTQYLFSAATVLAISSLLGQADSHSDAEGFENAMNFLEQLQQSGNFAANEFCSHVNGIKNLLQCLSSPDSSSGEPMPASTPSWDTQLSVFDIGIAHTAESAVYDPCLQQFLADDSLDLSLFDGFINDEELQSLC
ncbi:fungal-specific transcription factor domain-containing protein [Thelonectria olida]|uniref:Fungal-specific transcription factor domain-containing protein n=1 Tax=Thelonectria olida TaxID=1576542 RepID=A0A9P9AHT3_9HYPO|nr:fungal-specific transcription factor domain-containing protein [Thelonectria olida]